MDDYIERRGLFDALYDADAITAKGIEIFRNYPAADVVPVVRCAECENWQSDWKPSAAKDGTHFCANIGLCTSADWFCADGEQKDGEEE